MVNRALSLGRRIRSISWLVLCAIVIVGSGCTLNTSPDSGPAQESISGAPTVRIVAPLPNATYLEGITVNIQAQISNAGPDIDRVEVLVDNTIVATLTESNPNGAASFSITHVWPAAGLGAHTIGVTAFRPDGTSSAPASVNINVVAPGGQTGGQTNATVESGGSDGSAVTAQPTTQTGSGRATVTPRPTATQGPTDVPASATPDSPQATFTQGINVRSGPGTIYNPPIGSFAAGQTTEILARNPAGDWYKVRYYNGEGWVFGGLLTVAGDTSSLPVDPGPPPPTAAPPTAIPPTAVIATAPPATNANLVAGVVVLSPAQPRCAETFNVGFDVANLGSEATASSGTVSLQDLRAADGSPQGSTIGGFPVLQPGQTFRVDMPLTISTWHSEQHRIVLVIDADGRIPETVDGDNRVEITYTLEKGNCP